MATTAPAPKPELLRASEAAKLLGVSVWTIERLVESGELRFVRFGPMGWRRIVRGDVERLIAGDAREP